MKAIQQIKALRKDGLSYDVISNETGVPKTTLHDWVNNTPKYFKHIEKIGRFCMEFYSNKGKGDL